jgi:PAS domain S-box-containing protein
MEAVGAKSVAFVPLVTETRVTAVLVAVSTRARRTFTADQLALMQTLAAEASIALERTTSAQALAEALERERLVARISSKVRSELDLDDVLRVAVEETGRAVRAQRSFIRLGEPGQGPLPIAAEWAEPGAAQIGERAARLAVSNLVARERKTLAVDDIRTAPELDDASLGGRDPLFELETLAVLATPIVVFDELVGVFGLHRAKAGAWSSEAVMLAEAIAREVGLAVHTAGLLRENAARIQQQGGLLKAAQELTGELELEVVLQRLVDQVAQLLDVDAADCHLLDLARGTLRCAAVHGLPADLVGTELPADRGPADEALRTARPVLARAGAQPAHEGFAETAVAPMTWSESARGVLAVHARAGRTFDRDDADVLEAFAGLASLALRNAGSFAERTRQARIQRGFYRIASALSQSLSLAATLDAVAQAAGDAFGASFAAVFVPRGGRLELAGGHELPQAFREGVEGFIGEEALERAARERRVLAAPAVRDDDRFEPAWHRLAERSGFRGLLAVPIQAPRQEAAGLVLVLFADERRLSDDDLELARHLAGAAEGALERSELFEAERTARALAQQLARTGSLLATELDPDAVLEEVVQQAPAMLGADACTIRVLDGEELVVRAAAGAGAEAALGSRSSATAWLSGDVVQSGAPVALEDVGEDRRLASADLMLGAEHSAFLGVPLVGPEGALHGVLAVYGRRPRTWRPEEIEALLALGANTSAALSNAELYQRVADEKERNSAILANIADGIVAVDREGHVVLWNQAAEQITGVPQAEAIGRLPAQVLQRTLESDGDSPVGDRLVSIQRGQEEVWLSLTEAIMRDPAGGIAGRIFAFRDISADRFVEQMKSDFVSTVSHELRTPLTSIYGFAETLLRQDVLFGEDERRTFLGYIASESERLTEIVDALLNVARLEGGDLQVNLAPVDVRTVVNEAVSSVSDDGLNGHRFVVDVPSEPLAAEADQDKLRQILSVLLDNAVKYSPGGGTVTVAARRTSDAVELEVADEGIGIPQTEQQRIFRKFYRAEGGDSRGSGGTGLGLFIAQELVSAMGGRISVRSAEGEGASFSVELPLARLPVAGGRD